MRYRPKTVSFTKEFIPSRYKYFLFYVLNISALPFLTDKNKSNREENRAQLRKEKMSLDNII